MLRQALVVSALLLVPANFAFAQAPGSPEEKACRPDVVRLCKRATRDQDKVLQCLRLNAAKLGKACLKVLRDNGQL